MEDPANTMGRFRSNCAFLCYIATKDLLNQFPIVLHQGQKLDETKYTTKARQGNPPPPKATAFLYPKR